MLSLTTTMWLLNLIYAILALIGAVLVVYTAYASRKADSALLRARAFLNESFIKDSWILLFLACLLFFINAAMSLNGIFGVFIEAGIATLIAKLAEVGKWYALSCWHIKGSN